MSESELPLGWQKKSLGSLVSFQKGKKTDTSKSLLKGYARYLGASGLSGKDDGFADTGGAVIAETTDLLMLWDGERSGLVGCMQQGVVASTVSKLTPTGEIDSVFLYYKLVSLFDWIQARRTGTGVPHVPKDLGKILDISYPTDKKVQKNIASILSNLDNQIDATQALINKYAAIKQGMMADLFSRGIDPETKALRPTFEEAPELYHETPLGMLPKGWNVIELEHLLADVASPMRSGPFGSALLKQELVNEGIPLLGIDNIFVERFKANFKRFVTESKFTELSRYAVREGDVVITIMGTVGRSCVIPKSIGRALSSKHLWTMTFDKELVLPELVCWQLNHSPWAESWFRRESQGGVMDAIQSQTLKKLKLIVPSLTEQLAICKRYETLKNHIGINQVSLDKLKAQKSGLMQDLLTGKVAVPAQNNHKKNMAA
ncbi:restriction endonuclease subunit S [Xenorhabdus bovienii]|uniref:restriction endonuclease subunit S n=1 Tax=Xenorhabdus bovienii TaxID=40576 RepID=UPI0023B34963|nr:restriction endonuclease subunit S [Xenorhabdus bovienii]MDE9557420.1 restriction endonuclease subunit S [Xenorhabdus bovienii]